MTTTIAREIPETLTRTRRVLIVDDQRTFCDLLRVALSAQPDLECVGLTTSLDAAVPLVEQLRPDLVIMDVQFEGESRDGISVTAQITAVDPSVLVILLTGMPTKDILRRAAAAGACSVLAKDGSLADLLQGLRTARTGGLVVQPQMLRWMLVDSPAPEQRAPTLTQRERDVLAMLELGIDTRSIASQLGISVNTCRGYIKTLLSKLDAHSQLEAVAVARSYGLFDAEVERRP